LVGDLVAGLVPDYRIDDAVSWEACEFGNGIEVCPVVEQDEVVRRHCDPDRAELQVDSCEPEKKVV
jgi:hypothetical protein